MRKIIFRGKRTDNNEWVYGVPVEVEPYFEMYYFNFEEYEMEHHLVAPETIGQYTGMKEFVVSDKSFDKPLFEGDIVEVWSTRRPKYEYWPRSQYDGDVKVRAVICFKDGTWTLDYKNKYNEFLKTLRGREEDEREVDSHSELYRFGCHGDEEWQREHNSNWKWGDIMKIGNIHDNPELLEERE